MPSMNVKNDTIHYNAELREAFNADMQSAFIPLMIVITLESIIGIIGNSVVFYVFYSRYKKCNFKYFALFLCAIDLSGCLTSMPLDIVLRYYYFDVPGRMFCKFKFFFLLGILLAETFTLLIISIDRFRKICRPLQWQIGNKAAVRLCIIAIVIAGTTSGFITFIITGKNYEKAQYKNMTIVITHCGADQAYKNSPISGISIIIECAIIVGTLIVMIVLYVLVARQLYATKAAFDSKNGCNKDKPRNTFIEANVAPARRKSVIAITLTSIFIITISIHSVFIFLIASEELNNLSKSEWAIYSFLYTTYLVNYCINPIIYGCLDHQFRKFLRDIRFNFCGKRESYSTGGGGEKTGGSTVEMDRSFNIEGSANNMTVDSSDDNVDT